MYQEFALSSGKVTEVGRRMRAKLEAVPLPEDLSGQRLLDVGCDYGFWSFLAAERGAQVVAVDRGREDKGVWLDLVRLNQEQAKMHGLEKQVEFRSLNLGKQWHQQGKFDYVLCLSVYHHAFEAAGGDHHAVLYWLWRQCVPGATVLWEGPVGHDDRVVRMNVTHRYDIDDLLDAAARWFWVEYVGPAKHEPTREVFRFIARDVSPTKVEGAVMVGGGGATGAFEYAQGRRIKEIGEALGWHPYPGSLNLLLLEDFDWQQGYYRVQLLDVIQRGKGFSVPWQPRWCRFAPVLLNGKAAFAMRFEGEGYPEQFVELVAGSRLRDGLKGDWVCLARH